MRALLAGVLALSALAPRPDRAFSNVAVGDPVRDRELAAAAGGKAPLLGDARASVFVFFRTDSENSAGALDELSFVERDLAAKGARFVAVVSDSDDVERAKAMMRHAGLKMPLLVDARDALYGELGVRLHPVVGVVAKGRLAAYEHYRKVGFRRIVRGRIEVALGEAREADLEKVLSPSPSRTGDALSPARRWVALGRKELARGDAARAEASARKGVGLAPGHAPAHVLLGKALAVQGRCAEARAAFEAALRLAPTDQEASEGLRDCAGR
ncbi:MAG TPA: tetratricopeptide repeat protein [Anaeromyxobacter sp.]|nr:tetratricopeptide repeat protein [Anaeromyxobacter sp.]